MPVAALLNLDDADAFWAARRVAAFSDQMIRAAVATGEYTDPAAARHLAAVLIERRDKVARAYLAGAGSLVDLSLRDDTLAFSDAAVDTGAARTPQGGYRAVWARFDNATGGRNVIGESTANGTRVAAPARLPRASGSYVQVAVRAINGGGPLPTVATFLRVDDGWRLVGVTRSAELEAPGAEVTE